MNKLLEKIKWFCLIILLAFLGCKIGVVDSGSVLIKIDVAKWNQLNLNYLIDSCRIDTTSFLQLKQPPPNSKDFAYSYPIYASVFNNDIATIWNFINKRNLVLDAIDSLYTKHLDTLEIIEFYKFNAPAIYEVTNGRIIYEITLKKDGSKTITRIFELSTLISGFEDNRGEIAPIRTLTMKSKIFNYKNECDSLFIETLYIDSSE